MANPTIIIDAGHGGFDNGASDNGRLEKDDNLRLAMAVGNRLEADGFPVLYTRTTDVYQRPIDKARIANENDGDYFVSFHRNASPERNTYSGVQTLVYADEGIKGELARNINYELGKVGFADLGVPIRTNLVVLKRTKMPAVLIETGFINTDADNALFDEKFEDIADAIARAIEETVGENDSDGDMYLGENDSAGSMYLDDNNIDGDMSLNDNDTASKERFKGNRLPSGKRFGVQVGLYTRYENALYQAMELEDKGYDVSVMNRRPFYAVVAGSEEDIDSARELEKTLQRQGYDTLIINLP